MRKFVSILILASMVLGSSFAVSPSHADRRPIEKEGMVIRTVEQNKALKERVIAIQSENRQQAIREKKAKETIASGKAAQARLKGSLNRATGKADKLQKDVAKLEDKYATSQKDLAVVTERDKKRGTIIAWAAVIMVLLVATSLKLYMYYPWGIGIMIGAPLIAGIAIRYFHLI